MLKHNLLLVFRSFVRSRATFIINTIGLSTGLACALLIFLWTRDELNVDHFNSHDESLYQIMSRNEDANGIQVVNTMPPVLAQILKDEMPEVESAVMEARIPIKYTLSVGNNIYKEDGVYAGSSYFHVLSYKLVTGDKEKALTGINSVVISKSLALRMFNTTDVVGKVLTLTTAQEKRDLSVTGVFIVPSNASYKFDFILPFKLQFLQYPNLRDDWSNSWANTYVRLREGVNANAFNEKIKGLPKEKAGELNSSLFAQRYSSTYLHGNYTGGIQSGGRIEYVRMFSIIGALILLVACINFMNLSTAKASKRLKEVGVKKVMGANRKGLILQYMTESLALTILSVLLAICIVFLILHQFNFVTGKDLSFQFDTGIILALVVITLITGLISGSYPAFYLSSFNPLAILKGKLYNSFSESAVRKGLIVFQFVLSVTLITSVVIIYKQIKLIQDEDPGYSRDNVVYFDMDQAVKDHLETFLAEVRTVPGVLKASNTFLTFLGDLNSTPDVSWPGKSLDENISMQYRRVNYGMIDLLGIRMKEGNDFSPEVSSNIPKVIFNEEAIRTMGLSDPIGKTVHIWSGDMEIVGVTDNFHFESLHEQIKPLFFILNPERTNTIMIKIQKGHTTDAIARLEKFYSGFTGGMPLDLKFLDDKFQAQYHSEAKVSVLSRYFAGLAIVISCLGLYGLVMFTAEKKRKEIAIRKTLGSASMEIVYLLAGQFTKMVLVAIIIAVPLSYWIAERWLHSFAYRIDIRWSYFVLSGASGLLIAWLTISIQALKAANANPVKSLRSE